MTGEGKSWRAVAIVPSRGHVLMITLLAVPALARGTSSTSPRGQFPVLTTDFGVMEGVLHPIGEALSRRTIAAPARARAVAGAVVISAHAGLF